MMKRNLILCLLVILSLFIVAVGIAETDRSISITSDTNVVFVKKQLKLQAEVSKLSDSAPAKTNLVWESDHPEIAKVSNGIVAGVSVGKATIKASAKDNPDIFTTFDVEVGIAVKTVKADPSRIDMYVGEKLKDEAELSVTVAPDDAYFKDVVITSSNEKVVTVDANGKIKAVGPGNARITVASAEPGSSAKANVNITVKEYVDRIVIEEKNVTVAVKKNKAVKVNIEPNKAANKKLKWVSADESIVKVSNNGQLTGVECGTTTVTATTEDTGLVTETINVTVIKDVKKIAVDYKSLILEPGVEWPQEITVNPEDATNKKITWKSSDEKIATVDSSGKITPVAVGKCKITGIAQDGYKAKVEVPVVVKKHDVVITEPGPHSVDFPVRDSESRAGIQVGNLFWGSTWTTTVKYSKKCVAPAENGDALIPVKPGSDVISVVEKENRKTTSKKKYTIFVAKSACPKEENVETKEENGKTADDTAKKKNDADKGETWKEKRQKFESTKFDSRGIVGLSELDLMDGSKDWTVGNDDYYMGDAAIHTVGKDTGIVFLAGTHGPDPLAISSGGNILWRSNVGVNDEITEINLTNDYLEVVYKNGYAAMLEYNGELIDVLTPDDH